MLELRENALRRAGCNGRRMSCRLRMYSVAIWRKTRRKSLTVKALNPFSPFISLAPNIKHAVKETVMGQILAAALFWSKSSYHSGLGGHQVHTVRHWHTSFVSQIVLIKTQNKIKNLHKRRVSVSYYMCFWFAKRDPWHLRNGCGRINNPLINKCYEGRNYL